MTTITEMAASSGRSARYLRSLASRLRIPLVGCYYCLTDKQTALILAHLRPRGRPRG